MKGERPILILAVGATLMVTNAAMADLLTNGDFEMPSILGEGQTEVGPNESKLIETNPASPYWEWAISGVQYWDNALEYGDPPSRSDQGIATYDDIAGDPNEPRYAFINNWDRRFNQTVSTLIEAGVTYTATIDFATRLDDPGQNRAGLFELRAGPMNPNDPDDPGSSILLDSLTAGTAGADPDVVVNDREWTTLALSYTPTGPADPAVGRPLTLTFRTEWGSAGPTLWDNATLIASCPGDVDGDGDTDLTDLALLLSAYGSVPGDPNWDAAADFDNDNDVDLTDLAFLLSGYGCGV